MLLDIDLNKIHDCSSLTPNILGALREAAQVVLQQVHGQGSEIDGVVKYTGKNEQLAVVRWSPPSTQELATHDNINNASEDGATAIAIVTMFRTAGYRVVRRAPHGSGADYLMRPPGTGGDEFIRLEVSGIVGKDSTKTRLLEKVNQLQKGNLRRPGVAAVIKFSGSPMIIVLEDVP